MDRWVHTNKNIFCYSKVRYLTAIMNNHNAVSSNGNGTDANKEEGNNISSALGAVFVRSGQLPFAEPVEISGPNFSNKNSNDGTAMDIQKLLSSMKSTGFQATALADAAAEVNRMITCRMKPADPPFEKDLISSSDDDEFKVSPVPSNCTIFLSYTSNMVSSGLRDVIRYLVEHSMVDCIITTAGGIEEDIIKCLAPTYLGSFSLNGAELRQRGINRIGNLLVPNDNYCKFEDWLMPILDAMLAEEKKSGLAWTPSRIIARLGKEIADERSILYWAFRNKIPVFCPAITDGSLGDMLFFHSYRHPGLTVDILDDLRRVNNLAIRARHSGMIILGGGIVKHHTCNANLMRNGADFTVYINTAAEFDGSDAGASPDEAVSWGKIRGDSHPVKVFCDATIAFPLVVAGSFAARQSEIDAFNAKRQTCS